jgi:carbamoyl-phosphate synthase small subunit
MTTQILSGATGVLVLADGTVLSGIGVGATGSALGEVVFNTSMTGYQEILTDPSYMSQILAFTFPHIGNVGVNLEDIEQIGEAPERAARGVILRDVPTDPANWRASGGLDAWM